MASLLQVLLGALTLGLPLWFHLQDRRVFPRLRWIREGEGPPAWGRAVVFVGVAVVILIALAAPIAGFHPEH